MSSFLMNRRRFIANAAILGGAATMQNFISVRAGNAVDIADVKMQLGWLGSNGVLGEVVAKKKGFYTEQGVNLEIVPGGPNIDGVAGVASGQAAVGQTSSSPAVMLARGAGIPIKAFLAGYQKHPFTYFSTDKNPIRMPQDMIGKTIATQPTAVILLRALLAKNGIAENKVTIVNMGSDMNQLLTGQAQAVTGWNTNINAMKVLGTDSVQMMLWDAGLKLYANVYFTTDDQIDKHGDVLARFTMATAKGWSYARDNQAEAVDILVEAFPNLDKASELEAAVPVLGYSFGETTKKDGWGTMNKSTWEDQIKAYADLGQFKQSVPLLDDVVSFSVLEATSDFRKKLG
ncbi:ABC transporter substrate-binding protein [Agrobacterium salinitolerans]|uniref:ABC transporter substrate-binding protein n=1 Tax=Agrobacterium salinitolerans TaxID=1183413 RepID=UPI001571C451|nr:ABC transporter substrate-binding protein [Agrobacterium salinitolerans]NTA40036.1 ABC transporter substrate-binding protein [Agrobacterium salinitolerans]